MTGTVRQPRALIKVNGQITSGWVSWHCEANTFHDPDLFEAVFALSDLPSDRPVKWFGEQTRLDVEILAGFPADPNAFSAAELTSIFYGRTDDISVQWDQMALTLTGRDLTEVFLDAKTSEKYTHQTASQVAEKLAAKYGLDAKVTKTTTLIGKYLQQDNVALQDQRTEWDLLTWLARQENFVAYVSGKTLHFEPKPALSQKPALNVRWSLEDADMVRLSTSRTLTVAKSIEVTVRSWNSKQKKAFTRKATKTASKSADVQKYSVSIPGLTPEQAQQRANQLLAEKSAHEYRISLEMPADLTTSIADVIKLTGTGTAWDQTYFPDSITRSMSAEEGFEMTISAKNSSPESEPTL